MGRRRRPGGADAPQAAPAAAPPPPVPSGPSFRTLLACHGAVEADESSRHGPVDKHPENPSRLENAVARLKADKGLWHALRKLPPRRATDAELQLCHDAAHITGLQKIADLAAEDSQPHFLPVHGPVCMGGPCAEVREGKKGADTYVTRGSLEAARFAAGGLLQMVDAALTEPEEGAPSHYALRTGLALCRPPGHHASSNRSQGFCLLNSVAVAAAYARRTYPEVERVLIFDWDVHHGQGTQEIFEQSRDVLVVNVHRHDGRFYPGSGNVKEVGAGAGRGYTVNVPLPAGYGGAALWESCASVLVPAARQFRPHLILVSAGFDAVVGDPLGACAVEAQVFRAMTTELLRLAAEVSDGRLLLALEGGYNVDALADCIEEVARALVDETALEAESEPFAEPPAWLKGDACRTAIRRACEAHKSLPLRLPLPTSKSEKRKAKRSQDEAPASSADTAEAAGGAEAGTPDGAAAEAGVPEPATFEAEAALAAAAPAAAPAPASTDGPSGPQPVAASAGEAPRPQPKPKSKKSKSSAPAPVPEPVAPGSLEASIEVLPRQLVIRICPVDQPQDLMASERELWLWHGLEAKDKPKAAPLKWRFEGALADVGGALQSAEFRRPKRELTVRLRLGPILGGPVRLAPLAGSKA